jgi:FkbM family methyltransferase
VISMIRKTYFWIKKGITCVRKYGLLSTLKFMAAQSLAGKYRQISTVPVAFQSGRSLVSHRFAIRNCLEDIKAWEKCFLWDTYAGEQIRDAASVLDLGGNVGMASAFFRQRFPLAKIVTLEPHPGNFVICEANLSSLDIQCQQRAVWAKSTRLYCINDNERFDSFQFVETPVASATVVDTVTLDDLIDSEFQGKVDLVKIDIEGAESELFAEGSRGWLEKVRSVIIEFHDGQVEAAAISILRNTGFSVSRCGEDYLAERITPSLP